MKHLQPPEDRGSGLHIVARKSIVNSFLCLLPAAGAQHLTALPCMGAGVIFETGVQSDIVKQLRLNTESLVRVVSSFDRPNIR
eukprot:1158756-Pelagomonas_calceolata.AAC.9